jgi:hypothetical protein
MTDDPWRKSDPPKDRAFLAVAITLGIPEKVRPVRIVVEWDKYVHEWRPVKAPGDTITPTKVKILCWAELPDMPLGLE